MLFPFARREGLIVEELQHETLVYDLESHKAHSLNATAAVLWRACDGKNSVSDLARIVGAPSDLNDDEEVVLLGLARLNRASLLVDYHPEDRSITRRQTLRKIGLAGALTIVLPVVHSIVVPTPAQAQTCANPGGLPTGTPCTDNSQCCSGVCLQGPLQCQ